MNETRREEADMKRMLAICLLICWLGAAALGEGNVLLTPREDEYYHAMLTDGKALYLVGSKLLIWREGRDAPERWEDGVDLPDGNSWRSAFAGLGFFMNGDALCGARLLMDGDGEAEALQLCAIALTDAGRAEARDVRTLKLPAALRDSGVFDLQDVCVVDGVVYLLAYGERGCVLCAADTAGSGAVSVREPKQSWNDFRLFAAPGGPILAEMGYDEGTTLYRVAPDGAQDALCRLPPFTGGVAVDPLTGAAFAVLDGRIRPVDMESGTLGDPVSALPLWIQEAAAFDGGRRYAALMQNAVAVVDANGPMPEASVLSFSSCVSGGWMDQALLEFTVAHPELALAKAERPAEQVLDDMLTRSADVDVFIMDMTEGAGAYEALLTRGYMLPLDGRAALREFCGRMYPGIQRWMSAEGEFVALPIQVYGRRLGVSEALLGRLDLTLSDVPDTWMGFLEFLEDDIQPRLDRLGPDAGLTYGDLKALDFRFYLRMQLLEDWTQAARAAGVAADYGDERLLQLLEKVDGLDYAALGLEEGASGDWETGGHGYSYGSEDRYLIQFSAPCDLQEPEQTGTPLLLGFGEDLPGAMALNVCAAFINPYTAHPEAALDLMETLLKHLPEPTRYALCPDLTEPLLRPEAEQALEDYRREIDRLRSALEGAEPSDRQLLEAELAQEERLLESYEARWKWLVAPGQLQWYRANGSRLTALAPDWFDQDSSGEAYELMRQYDADLIDARQFLAAVSQKARMMALEAG